MNNVVFSAQSTLGKVRANNEDNLYCDGVSLTPENRNESFALTGDAVAPCVFAVCDGMGGQADGEFASLSAVQKLADYATRIKDAQTDDADLLVQTYVTEANHFLCDEMRARAVRMGTTLALVVIRADGIHTYSIGDSRIYALTNGDFRQISEDHTLVTPKIKMGILTEEQARKDHDWHKLTAYLGVSEDELELYADVLPVLPVDVKTRLLLCSDGLTDMVYDNRIEEILKNTESAALAADALLNEALGNGGKDNTTCVVIDIEPSDESNPQSELAEQPPAAGEQQPEPMQPPPAPKSHKRMSPARQITTQISKFITAVRKAIKK